MASRHVQPARSEADAAVAAVNDAHAKKAADETERASNAQSAGHPTNTDQAQPAKKAAPKKKVPAKPVKKVAPKAGK